MNMGASKYVSLKRFLLYL